MLIYVQGSIEIRVEGVFWYEVGSGSWVIRCSDMLGIYFCDWDTGREARRIRCR